MLDLPLLLLLAQVSEAPANPYPEYIRQAEELADLLAGAETCKRFGYEPSIEKAKRYTEKFIAEGIQRGVQPEHARNLLEGQILKADGREYAIIGPLMLKDDSTSAMEEYVLRWRNKCRRIYALGPDSWLSRPDGSEEP